MFVELTNRQNRRMAVNMDNIVFIEMQDLVDGTITNLASNVAQGDRWHVIQVVETLDQIVALVRGAGSRS
jgi:hypothetical protein